MSIFPTEVAETYFCRSAKGKNATGKLYNTFVNTRSEIIDAGLLLVNRRNMNKSELTSKITKTDLATSLPEFKTSKVTDAMKICCSSDCHDESKITPMWESCFSHRQVLLLEKSTLDYFNMFPFLKESKGFKLVSSWIFKISFKVKIQLVSDANQKQWNCKNIGKLELVATKIFERLQRQFKGESLPKNYLQNYQNSADPVVLSLVLLPYLFTVVKKRASSGAEKVTKLEMYNKFFPHFPVSLNLRKLKKISNLVYSHWRIWTTTTRHKTSLINQCKCVSSAISTVILTQSFECLTQNITSPLRVKLWTSRFESSSLSILNFPTKRQWCGFS